MSAKQKSNNGKPRTKTVGFGPPSYVPEQPRPSSPIGYIKIVNGGGQTGGIFQVNGGAWVAFSSRVAMPQSQTGYVVTVMPPSGYLQTAVNNTGVKVQPTKTTTITATFS